LLITSLEGVTLRRLSRTPLDADVGSMLSAVARDAPKLRLGKVHSTTVYFDKVRFVLFHCDSFLLTFATQSPNAPRDLGDVAASFAKILSVREKDDDLA